MISEPRRMEHPRRRSRSMSRLADEFSGLGHHPPLRNPTPYDLERSLVQMGRAPSRAGVIPSNHGLHASHVGQYLGPHLPHAVPQYQGATHTRTYMPGLIPGQTSVTSSYATHRGGQPQQLMYSQTPYAQHPTQQIMLSANGQPVHYMQIGGNGLSGHHQQMYGGSGVTYAARVSHWG